MMKWLKRITAAITIFYTFCLFYWMFIGFGRGGFYNGDQMRYNIIPFKTINNYFTHFHHFNLDTWIINMGGNIGVFIPFGFSLPILFGWRFGRTVLSFALFITVLEVLQMVTRRGSLDVDDIILNTLGAAVGYGIYSAAASISSRYINVVK